MDINTEILINKFGQNIEDISNLLNEFKNYNLEEKRKFIEYLIFLIIQSKVEILDVEIAIQNSKLKPTFTPCILLRKGGVNQSNLFKILSLPDNELEKVFVLFLHLYKVGYQRRYEKEQNSDKWWYWDLSDQENIEKINAEYPAKRKVPK